MSYYEISLTEPLSCVVSSQDHHVHDATGSRRAQETAFKLSGRYSVFNSFGGLKSGENIIGIDMRRVHYDEIIITGSSGGNWADTVKTLKLCVWSGQKLNSSSD